MKKIRVFILASLVFFVCCSSELNDRILIERTSNTTDQKPFHLNSQDVNSIKNSEGLVVLSDKYDKNDFVRFYNEDGTLWYEFTFYYDDSDGKFEYYNENFIPFAFNPDHFSLALKCVGDNSVSYEVIVNEQTGLKKYIKKDDPILKFVTWNEYVLNVFAVDFNKEENPLRESPNGKIKIVNLPDETTFFPVEIQGEWLKIRWGNKDETEEKATFGWIRWNKDQQLLIEL